MTSITAYGTLTATDPGTREVTYRLLPFGEPGRTSAGTITVTAGAVTVPDDVGSVILNAEHDRTRPLGRATAITEDAAGLLATFRIAATTAGADLLAEVVEGLRPGVSVELDDVRIRGGQLLAGTLTGAGAVTVPAFPSALVASDTPDQVDDDQVDDDQVDDDQVDPEHPEHPEHDDQVEHDQVDPDEQDPTVTATTVTAAAPPRRAAAATTPAHLIAAAARGELRPDQLTAALDDLVVTGNTGAFETSWLGSIWRAQIANRPLVDLFGVKPATTLTYTGFQLTDGLHVDDYAGDKVEIPTNTPTVTAKTMTLARMAGGVDVDRAYIDLGAQAVVDELVAWAIRDYQVKVEVKVETAALAAATSAGAAAAPVATLAAVIAKLASVGAQADGVFVAADVLAALAAITPAYAFIAGGLSLTDGTGDVGGIPLRVLAGLPAKTILGVDRRAGDFREKVLEVNALDIAKAGLDEAVYGYYGFMVTDARGIVKGTTT